MSQTGRQSNKKDLEKEKIKPKSPSGQGINRRTAIILVTGVVALILIIIGVIGYPVYAAPFRRTVITVNNTSIRMDYFLKRIKISGSDPITEMNTLTNEQIVRLGAPKLVSAVTSDNIDREIRLSANVSETEFKAWYRQTLNESGLSNAEYRDLVSVDILRARLQDYLGERMPTAVEQAHIFLIALNNIEDAETVRSRWAAGENFTALAKELSVDTNSGVKGGDIGWFPKGGVLTPGIENAAFDLATDNISDPIPVVTDQEQPDGTTAPSIVGYQVIIVPERAVRELDPSSLQALKNKVVDDWLSSERKNYSIVWHGLKDGFDSETYAWINYQVAKSKPPASTTTAPSATQ